MSDKHAILPGKCVMTDCYNCLWCIICDSVYVLCMLVMGRYIDVLLNRDTIDSISYGPIGYTIYGDTLRPWIQIPSQSNQYIE